MVCIVGYGYVGQATHMLLGKDKVDLIIDVTSTDADWERASRSDIIFICVPTPQAQDGSCDTSIVKGVIKKLGTKPLYVIRSTIPWTFEMPGYRLVANPEFLNQNAYMDVYHNQLLGGLYQDAALVQELYDDECIIVPWTVAWQVKYASNLYGAFKVAFWEMIQDITGNERMVYETWRKLEIGQGDMAQVGMDGFRGFGGACFPKDVSAMAELTQHPLIKAVLEYNRKLQDGS